MENIILLTLLYLIGISIFLLLNELVYRKFKPTGEITRKVAHCLSVLATVPFPYIFPSHWHILVLAVLFATALFITRNGKQLNSIHDVDRKSIGSYLLPVSIYITFLISNLSGNKFIFILPMLILAVCDPLAAILGINIANNNGRIKVLGRKLSKTWLGSGAFIFSSFVISIIALFVYRGIFDFKTFWLALAVAITSTLAEIISWRGSDNLSVPMGALLVLVLFL